MSKFSGAVRSMKPTTRRFGSSRPHWMIDPFGQASASAVEFSDLPLG
jgi:hypothetical protein